MIENSRAILSTVVRSLAVLSRRVMNRPEQAQKLRIGHLGGIEIDLNGFGVAGLSRADVLVSRAGKRTANIAHRSRQYAFLLSKCRFDTPKAARCKSRFFHSSLSYCLFVNNARSR